MRWPVPRDETAATAARVAAVLRALPSGDLPLRRVRWTAAEVGAHLVSLPARYRRMFDGPVPLPASLADDNERELAAVPEREPAALADRLTAEVAGLLDALGPDGDRPVWYFTRPNNEVGIAGIMLGELLMHGWDLPARRIGCMVGGRVACTVPCRVGCRVGGRPGRGPSRARRRPSRYAASCPRSSS